MVAHPCTSAPVLAVIDGIATTTSNNVAEFFGKLHKNIMQAIENLLPDLSENHRLNFQPMLTETETEIGR